ncbi:hypothetical protein N494_15065 [Clostridium botulinum A2B7 92]|uniref:hypothetical protein n=1 Tax=Clostridium botulinum TaxID=1491 RepID=UPI0007DFB21A|nr:hypothetical protein [Clostridium botulinum]KEI95736.1 hypothetical protein N494_15065 [Clostridium botulinum A2B7 92]
MLCDKDKKKLQRKLEDLHCNQCDVDVCLCGDSCDVATSICDCCIDPMQDLLNQLKNILTPSATIEVTLATGITQSFHVNQIVSIDDSIINIQNTSFISICNISRVRWTDISTLDQINLLPPVCTCKECDCCERPLRKNLNKFINANVALQFKGQQEPNIFQNITIKKVGLGIVIGQNTADGTPDAYSICKITRFNAML